jgi:Flp pilus assembly pilin Flp
MNHVIEALAVLLKVDRRGVTAVEYAIIAGAVAAVILAAFTALGGSISSGLATVQGSI